MLGIVWPDGLANPRTPVRVVNSTEPVGRLDVASRRGLDLAAGWSLGGS